MALQGAWVPVGDIVPEEAVPVEVIVPVEAVLVEAIAQAEVVPAVATEVPVEARPGPLVAADHQEEVGHQEEVDRPADAATNQSNI